MTNVTEISEVNDATDSLQYVEKEYTDCTIVYSLTFEQIKTLYALAKKRGYDKGVEEERDAWMCK